MRSTLLLALLVLPLALPAVNAAEGGGGFGVAPVDLRYGAVARGEPMERVISIQNGKDEPVRVELRATDEVGRWALPEDRALTLPARSTTEVPLQFVVPDDIPNGDHTGSLYVHFLPDPVLANGSSNARFAFAIRVNLSAEIGGPQELRLEAGGLYAPDTEEETPPRFHWVVRNTGNVRASPRVLAEVFRPDGSSVLQEPLVGPTLVPGTEENVTFRLQSALPRGQYVLTATLDVEGAANETAWFEVLEQGALRRSGTLDALLLYDVETHAQIHRIPFGRAAELRGPFTNTGELPVKVTLEGYVALEGAVVKEFTSRETTVDPGETAELRVLLNDLPRAGQYTITADAAYAEKVTPPRDAILILEGDGTQNNVPMGGLAPIALAIAACALLLRKRRSLD